MNNFFCTTAGAGGAALTKGNIWQGAAIGLVASGLNHLGNHIERSNFIDERLESMGKDPKARAEIGQSELAPFANEMYPTMMKQADNPNFSLKNELVYENGEKAYGQTVATVKDGVTRSNQINISRAALRSWHYLASTIGHELNHVIFFNTGVYDKWVKRYGVRADALNEYKAYKWELKWGGSTNQYEMNLNLRTFKYGKQ